MSYLRTYAPLITLALAIACLYCYGLSTVGVFDPDEPRYLAIGHAMAQNGDWITPHLWHTAWFEKPPLLYWMTALGTLAGLGPEMAGRLPTALLSLSFLLTMYILIEREFGREAATVSTALLATSAGWLAYSSLALTDLPLAVFFSLAVLLALPLLRAPYEANPVLRYLLIGLCLGLAALTKALVPLALSVPFFWFLRRTKGYWWVAVAACLLLSLPWYLAVYIQNGGPFLEELFWKQHIQRLYSPSLQHIQPWYYYLPVLIAGLFPWTPLFALLATRPARWDERRRFLFACFVFGVLLFSLSRNKLPGYLLPLLPAAFVLLGAHFERIRSAELRRIWFLASALLIGLLPLIARALPEALLAGRISSAVLSPPLHRTDLFYIAAPLAVVGLARRSWLLDLLVLSVVAGGLFVKIVALPTMDQTLSARTLWRQQLSHSTAGICEAWLNRDWAYGLAFYRGAPYPPCTEGHFDSMLTSQGRRKPELRPIK